MTVDEARAAVARALGRRGALLCTLPDTDAYRLIHGVADGFDGLTADRLGAVVLVERHVPSAPAEVLVAALAAELDDDTPIFLKERWSAERQQRGGGQVQGPAVDPIVEIHELGLRYRLDLQNDQHVGLFLDARPARARVRELAAGRHVLNLFAYTCAFGVAAAAGGARTTTNVDTMRSALATGRANYALNGLEANTRTFLRNEVFDHLSHAARGTGRYDLIVVDPPPRSQRKNRRFFRVERDYDRLLAGCARLLDERGLVMAGVNVREVDDDRFAAIVEAAAADAGRSLRIVERVGPGEDFPPAPNRPVGRFALLTA